MFFRMKKSDESIFVAIQNPNVTNHHLQISVGLIIHTYRQLWPQAVLIPGQDSKDSERVRDSIQTR